MFPGMGMKGKISAEGAERRRRILIAAGEGKAHTHAIGCYHSLNVMTRLRTAAFDTKISAAWLQAAKDLGIRVTAPFTLRTESGEDVTYEAHIADFGGPNGTVVSVFADESPWNDIRHAHGYYGSNLSDSYRTYSREHFVDTLNDWQWSGNPEQRPTWYTGKSWS